MKAYVVDEISPSDMQKITTYLKEKSIQSSLDKVFWVEIPEDLLAAVQLEHSACKPHGFAVEVGSSWVKSEFFIRSLKSLRCECQRYCDRQQRDFILSFVDVMTDELDIRT